MEKINNDIFNYYLSEMKRIKSKLGINYKYELIDDIDNMRYDKIMNKVYLSRDFIKIVYDSKKINPLFLERFIAYIIKIA